MIDILSPPSFPLSHFMCSQSGNGQDIASYSANSPSCMIEPDVEPDCSSKQEHHHPSSLPSDMGLRYMTIHATDDVRFGQDSGNSHSPLSPVYSIESAIQTTPSQSSLAYLPYTNLYPSLGAPSYPGGGTSYYSPPPPVYAMPDIKPRLTSLTSSSGMAPPSRSPALPHLQSPITARDLYTTATPHLRRTSELHSRSPSVSGTVRGVPLSPSSSGGFTSPGNMDANNASPPLHPTEVVHQLQASDGTIVHPEIFGRIDKGFFVADGDWTCYRRNYFSLNCSYTLHPALPNGNVHLMHQGVGGSSPQVVGFALSIAAVVDGPDGKSTELIQHTPKRDKGPQVKPARITVAPRPPPIAGMYGGDGGLGGPRSLYDTGFGQNPNAPQTEATFERIQFKNATANNGKRRAAQQYYHLLIELFADIGAQPGGERWVKIASRMSVPMVVRGRSPGHYHSERRGSNASTGPGGSGGAGSGGSYPPSGSSRTPGDMSMSGQSPMGPASSFNSSHDSRMQHFRTPIAPVQIPMDSTMSAEEARSIDEAPCYMYYPGAMYEGHENRYQLPSVSEYSATKVKHEYNNRTNPGYMLPSITSPQDGLGRHCGRWEGTVESKGYFPPALLQQEMNIT